ncbi:Cytochrome c-type protein NapC [Photobacterium marinum]|uniref:Cytochrome c-type protein n=1 Tax=Photobacterium marinum TaxID=1056511 RepID=L8JCZ2_9GAMM|nr:cytochrome c-type protein NapC [Photobacterium marinum]ELR66701.1 Cytochrome c-type protein NapC [Photobacterium marinum]
MGIKLPGFIQRFWSWFRKPSHLAAGSLLTGGIIVGIVFWGGFNTAMEMSNQEQFCISCHEMENNVYQEYVGTVHYNNRSGVRATCPDCHVPKEWGPKMVRKIQASKELYAKVLGIVDTPKKFEEHRFEMASREWERMKANDSQECRNCHNFEYMDFTTQKPVASKIHDEAEDQGKTCIDCHKGIAHQLPKGHKIEKAI